MFSALLQGGYVRRATSAVGEPAFIRRGMVSCAAALIILSMVPHLVRGNAQGKVTRTDVRIAVGMLHAAAALLSFTSATVVTSLTALASLQCDDEPAVMEDISLSTPKATSSASSSKPTASTGVASIGSEPSGSVRNRPTAPRSKGKLNSATEVGGAVANPDADARNYQQAINDNVTPTRNPEGIPTGRALGEFRSSGQLGRAIGPLLGAFRHAHWECLGLIWTSYFN